MSNPDESRYGRVCLLVLNICPLPIREMIKDYYTQHGSLSIQDFLEKNKHILFHLLPKKCCCRLFQSRITPMNNSQWDSLYMKNSSSCRRGKRIDCPCQYDAKPGITTSVMDITLCYLFIKNICPGITVNMAHVETIRGVRNNLIHAGSASLDEPTYLQYWNKVEKAIIDIASKISPTLHTDTKKMVKDLKSQVLNTAELAKELRRLIVDAKRIEDLEENVSDIADDLTRMDVSVNQATQKITETAQNLNQARCDISSLKTAVVDQEREIRGLIQEQLIPMQEDLLDYATQLDSHARQIDDHARQLDDHDKQIDEHAREIDDHATQLDDHVRQIDDHARQIDDNARQINDNARQIDYHSGQIDDHERQIDDHVRQIDEHAGQIDDHAKQIDANTRQIDEHSREIQSQQTRFQQEIADIKLQKLTGKTPSKTDIGKLKQRLIKINSETAKVIPISPLQERGDAEMPIELLYASVVIHEDPKYLEKGRNSPRGSYYAMQTDIEGLPYYEYSSEDGESDLSDDSNMSSQYDGVVKDPADIFIRDGNLAENIYMLGDAAHGKTTYCIWLLKKWCDAQQIDGIGNKKLDKWEKVLERFDFVFLLQFRNVNPTRASVIDMICQDLFKKEKGFHATIRHVLSSDNYRSLIIMDGLDEWNPNEETTKQLTCKGMPNIEDMASTVSCFISMRPWVLPTILKTVKVSDRVIEIRGLSETGMKKVIENVLLYHFKLKDDPSKYRATYDKIVRHLQEKSLKSFMQIPLLAVVCVQIWYKGKQVGDSMTSFYGVMLNMLIERADQKHELHIDHNKTVDCQLPEILYENEYIEEFISVLLKLGKVAYRGLLSKDTNLVFQKRKLEREIGVKELQFALDVGLISQKEAPSIITKNVSLHFFHKSIQEFLAVIYIVTQKEVSDSFCKQLSNVKIIMELSNVIMFICGMCPSLGSVISQRVVIVTDSDMGICKHRQSPSTWIEIDSVKALYKLQLSWYKELKYGRTDATLTKTDSLVIQTDSTVRQADSPVTFHVSDVYLDDNFSEMETVKLTRELMSDQNVSIRSLWLYGVSTNGERGINNKVLNNVLSIAKNTRSLTMLYIYSYSTDRSVPILCIPTLRCLHLEQISINTHLGDDVCPPLLTDMSQIRVLELVDLTLGKGGLGLSSDMVHIERIRLVRVAQVERGFSLSPDMVRIEEIELHNVNLGDRGLGLSPDMVNIEKIELYNVTLGDGGLCLSPDMVHIEKVKLVSVNMSAAGWGKFILSVSNIQHSLNVLLCNANIDGASLTMIRFSPDFTVTRDRVNWFGTLRFTRVWPRSQLTHDDDDDDDDDDFGGGGGDDNDDDEVDDDDKLLFARGWPLSQHTQ